MIVTADELQNLFLFHSVTKSTDLTSSTHSTLTPVFSCVFLSLSLLMPIRVRACACVYLPLSFSFRPSWSANWTSAAVCVLTKALAHSCTAASAQPRRSVVPTDEGESTAPHSPHHSHTSKRPIPLSYASDVTIWVMQEIDWQFVSENVMIVNILVTQQRGLSARSSTNTHTRLYLWNASGWTALLPPLRDGDEYTFNYS